MTGSSPTNGDALHRSVLNDITRVGGPMPSDAWSVGETDWDGLHLSDEGVDWIQAVANGETPDPPSDHGPGLGSARPLAFAIAAIHTLVARCQSRTGGEGVN